MGAFSPLFFLLSFVSIIQYVLGNIGSPCLALEWFFVLSFCFLSLSLSFVFPAARDGDKRCTITGVGRGIGGYSGSEQSYEPRRLEFYCFNLLPCKKYSFFLFYSIKRGWY
jgi:hypothetical protein